MSDARPRIVIADDQPDNLLILQDFLENTYQVAAFDDGSPVLDYFEAGGEADLVLLDVMMPGMSGFEVCRRLKATPATCHIPVIFLTSLDRESDETFALSLGADDFIHKPFSPPVVSARVRHHLKLGQLTRQLRERNEDLERLTGSMAGVGLWDLDIDENRLSWSAEMAGLLGLADGGLVGNPEAWWALLHADDAERVRREYREAVATGDLFGTEFRIRHTETGTRVLKINGVIRRDGAGQATRMLGNAQDVTDDRAALERVREAKQQAEAANAAKSVFLANMSHELRTPLNAISGFATLLRAGETAPDRQEQLEIISQSADALLGLIRDILNFTRIEAGRVTPEPRTFDLRRDLATVARQFLTESLKKGLTLNLTVAPEVPRWLEGDSALLRQILVNLIGNAVKFTATGRIDVRVQVGREPGGERREDETELLFQVSDTGVGIGPEHRERIFEIFEQEDNSFTRRFGGVGLGLAISKRLVSLLGGEIWLESTPNAGSRFFFTATVRAAQGATALPEALARPPSGAAPAILVVERDPFSLKLMATMLGRYGFSTVSATDSASALRLLREQKLSLILIDPQTSAPGEPDLVAMVRSGGFAGCDPGIPIVALTAGAAAGDRERLSAEGFTDAVSKPIDVAKLLEVIQQTLP